MSVSIDYVLNRLQRVKKYSGYWCASCPCGENHKHGDKNPSLMIRQDAAGNIYFSCVSAGCTTEEICNRLGISPADLRAEKPEHDKFASYADWYVKNIKKGDHVEKIYSYQYGKYTDVLFKVKFRYADGEKDFLWGGSDPNKKNGYSMTHANHPNRLYWRGDPNSSMVYLCEGEKDADTVYNLLHVAAVSAEDGAGAKKGTKWRTEYTEQLTGKTVLILWDNDDPGRAFAQTQAEALYNHAAEIHLVDLAGIWKDCPDGGDISDLVSAEGAEKAADILNAAVTCATLFQPSADPTEDATGAEHPAPADSVQAVEDFLLKATSEAYKPIKTGIVEIDRAFGGGFVRQTLVTLGAAPGAGKTIIAQQIFESIAKNNAGTVLYFNLEMSTDQLIARSLSRETGLTQLEVLQGYKWTPEQEAQIKIAARKYKERIAPNIAYNPPAPDGTTGSAYYQDIVETMQAEAEARGSERPLLVVVDYLQLLRDRTGRADEVETIKAALKAFKDFAITYNAVVFLIMAQSRAINQSGAAVQGAGRDTSAIEYSGDMQISLAYTKIIDGTYSSVADMDAAVKSNRRGVDEKEYNARSLVITKNRFGAERARVDMVFSGKESRFAMIDQKHSNVTPIANRYTGQYLDRR